MNFKEYEKIIKNAVLLLSEHCPRLKTLCYWAGTSSVSAEELKHRISFDLDFHTRKALQDVRPILAELQNRFPCRVDVIQAPDQFGSSFRCSLDLPGGEKITLEVLSNYEDVEENELVSSSFAPELDRISVSRYFSDKIQCIAERAEARDLLDVWAVITAYPDMREKLFELLARQDALIIAERLLGWNDESLAEDLKSYSYVNIDDAKKALEMLMAILKQSEGHNK